MTPAEMEAARRALVKAYVICLQNHDPDTRPLAADAEPFATALVATAIQLGWRAVIERSDWKQQAAPKGALDPEVREAARRGDYEALRAAYETTSTVPIRQPKKPTPEGETR